MRRPASWDETWYGVAQVIGQRSACELAQVGAVIVSATNRVISSGYNGPPAGLASEKYLGQGAVCGADCPRNRDQHGSSYDVCISIHAEANALLFADRRDVEGGTIYTTHVPCPDCLKLIANSGLVRVVCRDDGSAHRTFANAYSFLSRCGIQVDRLYA